MSGFFGTTDTTSKWGGYLKQAISNVETTFDSLLEQPPEGQEAKNVETWVDPVTGMVTTIEKPKRQPERDLSKRLAAVVTADKNKPSTLPDDPKEEKAEQAESQEDKETGKEEEGEVTDEQTTKEEKVEETMEVKKEGSVKNKKNAKKNKRAAKKEAQRNERALKEKDEKDQQQQEDETAKEEKAEGDAVAKEEKAEEDAVAKKEKTEGEEKLEERKGSGGQSEQEAAVAAVEKEEKQTAMPAKDTTEEVERIGKDKEGWKGLLDQREKQLLQAMETIAKLHDQIHQLGEEATENEARWQSQMKPDAALEELKRQLAAKDEQIEGLLREGEKLSKVELKHSTTIKRLRQEKTEQEKAMAELTKRWEKATQEGTQAAEKAAKRAETERRLQESVQLLTDLSEQQTKHINKLESDKLEAVRTLAETDRRLKDALDRIERARAQAKAEADQENAVVLEKEVKANDRLHKEFAKFKENAEAAERGWRKEQRELQIALQAAHEQAAQREDSLRKEVAELQKRCVEQEKMQFEMSVDESTAPLLRQIDELQTQHAIAIKNRDQTEQSLILSLQHSELEREKSVEKSKWLQAELDGITQRVDTLEAALLDLQKENARLQTSLDLERSVGEKQEERIKALIKEKEEMKENEQREQERLKNQYQRLMKERLNEERRQFEDRLKEVKPPTLLVEEDTKKEEEEDVKLQADIHQLQNQVDFYQTQLQSLTQSKNELSEEALSMSQEIDQLRIKVKKTVHLQQEHDQLNARYQTLLELLGERTEEVQELKADLADVKDMYRTQIVELVQKIDQLSKK
ncbi:hypothetical protein G6F46_009666 [Rhizopus delemar]|uniref:TATA element modulatory factor 1 TATA binding domain-containing protein n=2 Tax=Rhizopus TaxID=4842 RepID=A0A9P6YWK0_9FUNG|nr:hypothetical protein G6F55_008283 [Rhizopus delemar]KAG1540941.1 hypothetical protein G6F51_008212 [Rhizopus arrhizus]KAG1491683.1 hypothetical protein G6F54_009840 [Rhizopus delemar]KAG1506800.1 hypothetical protein G6F53_009425 [Rhizopus delemar]KAG1524735.1 hypothetical protein G6F52_003945 [Rhizopus delemar]